jgi:A/G-specific adenine glycosylase
MNKQKLLQWYNQNKRDLPWRNTQDPYMIWISEVMLQQTTVKAVIPYYEKFLKKFPTVKSLSKASIKEVYTYWAGLGYYSRADNLHKASKQLSQTGFPKTHTELLEYPGFGPYTSRAVSSFAFKDKVGVLDGNVIRFLSRYHGLSIPWWENSSRITLQGYADNWVSNTDSSQTNQALIEIGATICTPKSPSCLLCPVRRDCTAYAKNLQDSLPLKKERKKNEIWIWEPEIYIQSGKIGFTKNNYASFLKGKMIFPGRVKKLKTAPKIYNYKHNITHHEIFVKLTKKNKIATKDKLTWITKNQIVKINPASLIQKALKFI